MKGVGIGLGALSVTVVVAFGALAIPSAVEAGSIHLFNHPRPRADRFQNSYYGYYPTCWRRFPPGWACPLRESCVATPAPACEPLDHPPLPAPADTPPMVPIAPMPGPADKPPMVPIPPMPAAQPPVPMVEPAPAEKKVPAEPAKPPTDTTPPGGGD